MKILTLGMTMGALALTTLGAQAQTATGTMGTGTMGTGDMNSTTTMGSGTGMGTGTGMTGTMNADGTMMNGSMSGGSMSGGMMSGGMMSAPMAVSGTVTRYYVDRAGFVSAMDVQTAEGTRMVRFSPSMAQRLTATYPVGSTISGFVTSSGMGSMMNYDLAGTGTTMPAPGMMMTSMVNDLDILRSTPYVMLGAREMVTTGKLTGYVTDTNSGSVLALILDNNTLVRVPAQSRLEQASMAPEGVTDLLKGALVQVRGMEEAPRYGVVSPFTRRIVANGISVDGRNLGTFGFGRVPVRTNGGLVQFGRGNMMGMNNMNMNNMNMGYMPYMAPGSDASMSNGMTGGTNSAGTMSGGTGGAMGTMNGGTGAMQQ